MTSMKAIKVYFGDTPPHNRKVGIDELKALSPSEREELGKMACAALGEEWEPAPTK
jgi:hypothetical protein